MLPGLRDNPLDGSTIRDSWEQLAKFYETYLMCEMNDVAEDLVKLQLFSFSLIGWVKELLYHIPNDTIQTWKDLEDGFLERYFFNAQFIERKVEISNSDQGDSKSLSDAWERIKLLLQGCPNHNMSDMK